MQAAFTARVERNVRPPRHHWTDSQINHLLELITGSETFQDVFFPPPNFRSTTARYVQERALCLMVLRDTGWMDWLIKNGWVRRGKGKSGREGSLEGTGRWSGHSTPVGSVLEKLQREMPRLELMLGKWESANEIPPGTSSHAVWADEPPDDWQKRRKRSWYFAYRKLVCRHSRPILIGESSTASPRTSNSPIPFGSAHGSPTQSQRGLSGLSINSEEEIIEIIALEESVSPDRLQTSLREATISERSSTQTTGCQAIPRVSPGSPSANSTPRRQPPLPSQGGKRRFTSSSDSDRDPSEIVRTTAGSPTKRPKFILPRISSISSTSLGCADTPIIIDSSDGEQSSSNHSCPTDVSETSDGGSLFNSGSDHDSDSDQDSDSDHDLSICTSSVEEVASPTPEPPIMNRRDSILKKMQEQAGIIGNSTSRDIEDVDSDNQSTASSEPAEDDLTIKEPTIPPPRSSPFLRPATPSPPPEGFPDETLLNLNVIEETSPRVKVTSLSLSPISVRSELPRRESSPRQLEFLQPLIGAQREWSPITEATMTDARSVRSKSVFSETREGMDWVDDDVQAVAAASEEGTQPVQTIITSADVATRILSGNARPPLVEQLYGSNGPSTLNALMIRSEDPTGQRRVDIPGETITGLSLGGSVGTNPEMRSLVGRIRPAVSESTAVVPVVRLTPNSASLIDRLAQSQNGRMEVSLSTPSTLVTILLKPNSPMVPPFKANSSSVAPMTPEKMAGSLVNRLRPSSADTSGPVNQNRNTQSPTSIIPSDKGHSSLAKRLDVPRPAVGGDNISDLDEGSLPSTASRSAMLSKMINQTPPTELQAQPTTLENTLCLPHADQRAALKSILLLIRPFTIDRDRSADQRVTAEMRCLEGSLVTFIGDFGDLISDLFTFVKLLGGGLRPYNHPDLIVPTTSKSSRFLVHPSKQSVSLVADMFRNSATHVDAHFISLDNFLMMIKDAMARVKLSFDRNDPEVFNYEVARQQGLALRDRIK